MGQPPLAIGERYRVPNDLAQTLLEVVQRCSDGHVGDGVQEMGLAEYPRPLILCQPSARTPLPQEYRDVPLCTARRSSPATHRRTPSHQQKANTVDRKFSH